MTEGLCNPRLKEVKVKFYPNACVSLPSCYSYRPHFVVNGDDELLGVEFLELDLQEFNVFGEAIVRLVYDKVGYHKLEKGVCFTIVEGGRIVVGEGYVLE